MGGACISKPKPNKRANLYVQEQKIKPNELKGSGNELQAMIPSQQIIAYPYYQPMWRYKKKQLVNSSVPIKQIISSMSNRVITNNAQNNYLSFRFYSYSNPESKKMFTLTSNQDSKQQIYKKMGQIKNKVVIKSLLFQNLILASPQYRRIQICPEIQYLVMTGESMQQCSQQSTITTTILTPKAVRFYMNENKQIKVQSLNGENEIKSCLALLSSYKKIDLTKNCLINGILFTKAGKELNGSKIIGNQSEKAKNSLNKQLNSILEIVQNDGLTSSNQSDQIILYFNPMINDTPTYENEKNSNCKTQYTTYLQFKAYVQQPKISIQKLFDPHLILTAPKCELTCVYILIFALKMFMYMNPHAQHVPMKFIEQIIKMKQGNSHFLRKIVNIIKFCYIFSIFSAKDSKGNQSTQIIDNCCRNILQISVVNSHILIDAYLLEFSIQVEQRILSIRQNPLFQPQEPLKFRTLITKKPDLKLINSLKNLFYQFKKQIISCTSDQIKDVNQIFLKWDSLSFQVIKNKILCDSISKAKNSSQIKNFMDFTSQQYVADITISLQYILSIKIYKFICESTRLLNIFSIRPLIPSANEKLKIIKRNWEQIIDDFMSSSAHSYCSGELAITILTLDGIMKRLDNSSIENQDESFIKALQIWFRIYRDCRAKYKPFISNLWAMYIIQTLINIKSNSKTNTNHSQQIFYLQNMLQCFYSNADIQEYIACDKTDWIIENIPINNISGIFYSKFDLFLPIQDQKSALFMKTGSSLLENPYDNLSSKSNFSQSMSNTNSTFGKGKKKNRRKIFDIINFSESRSVRNGVYQWGKGVNSVPLLYTLAKNLDVFKISCGSYHVVIATSIGIFGWGQNGSGQLGLPSSKQPVKGIKLVYQKLIQSDQRVLLACGNEHTAILIHSQSLVMFGQSQGGIISGNGKMFDFISCGGLHSLGIREGKVYSWGRGQGGQLGHKTQILKTKKKQQSTDFYLDEPKIIPNLPYISKSACGDAHSVLLSDKGQVFVFGFSYQGQLGLGLTGDSQVFQVFQPVKLLFNSTNGITTKIVDIFAGPTFTFFKTQGGQILSCGLNDCNQLGKQKMMKVFQKKKYIGKQNNTRNYKIGEIQFSKPNKIQIFNKQIRVNEIYCGQNHCLASVQYMKNNKMIMGWGLNKQFQISSEFPADSITPRTLDNFFDFNFSVLCCGSNFSLGLVQNENRIGLREVEYNIEQILKNSLIFNFKF